MALQQSQSCVNDDCVGLARVVRKPVSVVMSVSWPTRLSANSSFVKK